MQHDEAALQQLLNFVVGRRRNKVHVCESGELGGVVTVLMTATSGVPDVSMPVPLVLAAHILGSVAQGATPATLCAVLRSDAVRALLCVLESEYSHSDLRLACVRALRTIVRAISENVCPPSHMGMGSGVRCVSMSLQERGLPTTELVPSLSPSPRDSSAPFDASLCELHQLSCEAMMLLRASLPYFVRDLCMLGMDAAEPVTTVLACCLDCPALECEKPPDYAMLLRPYGSTADMLSTTDATPLHMMVQGAKSKHPATQKAALNALDSLLRCAPHAAAEACAAFDLDELALPQNIALLCQSDDSVVCLAAASCMSSIPFYLYPRAITPHDIVDKLLAGLKTHGSVQVQASFALAQFIRRHRELAEPAITRGHACERLTSALLAARSSDDLSMRLKEGCLAALTAIAVVNDSTRKYLLKSCDTFAQDVLVPAMHAPAVGVQVAACQLVRVLSRSMTALRTTLRDANVAARILPLLEHPHALVVEEVLAVLCNLLIKFSPMKTWLIEQGCIAIIARHAHAGTSTVRCNALWSLKNALWGSEWPLKDEIMSHLGWDTLVQWLDDDDMHIQRQALNIWRNVLASSSEQEANDVGEAMQHVDRAAFLDAVVHASERGDDDMTEQAAYVLANLASGPADIQEAILMHPRLLLVLCMYTQHKHAAVREAGVRCGLHLMQSVSLSPEAMGRLHASDYRAHVAALAQDDNIDVRHYAQSVVALL